MIAGALVGALLPGVARATNASNTVVLANDTVRREWRMGAEGAVTSGLIDRRTGRNWSSPSSPDFTIDVDGVTLTSASGWQVAVSRAPRTVSFVYSNALLTINRTYTLFAGSPVMTVESQLINRTPAPLRVSAYSLDELASSATIASTEVDQFHGGSDWRDDYRNVLTERAGFDDEGEVARFDDGTGAGWFFVSERRGGAMSRVGRDVATGRTWAGVDNARDLLDAGPLASDPPDYNRVENPAYPMPVRARTVPPLGSLSLGRARTGVYTGGSAEAAAAFARDFAAHGMPHFARSVGLNTFHPWSHGPGLSDANLRPQAALAKQLGVESFMLDDQWQGSASGDWVFDPARFPDTNGDGTPDFIDYLRALNLRLALWMSPAEFNGGSNAYRSHPQWACTPTGQVTAQIPDDAGLGVWDVTNPQVQDYLTERVDHAIDQWGVREFKFDFQAWVDCPPHDYLDYEDAFVALVRRFEARHPDVTFELDETNDQRLWPFASAALGPSWFDNGHLHGSGPVAKLVHDIWSATPWLPPSTIGTGLFDGTLQPPYTSGFLMPLALLGHVTFWSDLTAIPAADRAEAAWWIHWYKQHRAADLSGAVYQLTANDPIDGVSWAAFQAGHQVFAFRQGGAGTSSVVVSLHGLDPATTYTLTDARTGVVLGTRTGRQLARGLRISLPDQWTAKVITLTPATT